MRLDRMIFERMETRILVGITMFVSIMVLVGWVAINENARMASFEQQYLARSIERGAYLFAANCATCHGYDGLGNVQRAPALNSPALFGYDFLADVNQRETTLLRERDALLQALETGNYDAVGMSEAEVSARIGVGSIPYRLYQIDQEIAAINTRIGEIDDVIGAPPEPEAEATAEADVEATAESTPGAEATPLVVEEPPVSDAADVTPEATAEATPVAEATAEATPEISAEERAALETERADLESQIVLLEEERQTLEAERRALEAELAGTPLTVAPEATAEATVEASAEATPAAEATAEATPAAQAAAESTPVPVSEERTAEINARLGTDTIWAELDALVEERDALVLQMQPAIDINYDPSQPARLAQIGYNNTLEQYVYTTLVHGRPGSALSYPASNGGMVAWGQIGGGPLRGDEVQDLTNFILNWDKGDNWTIEDLNSVRQFPILPGAQASADMGPPVGTDVAAIVAGLGGVTGDPAAGERHYRSLGCSGCHTGGAQAPSAEGTWTRVETERLSLPQFAGYTVEQYLVESIVNPGAYIVPPYAPLMPSTFSTQMDIQMMADVLAYLQEQG